MQSCLSALLFHSWTGKCDINSGHNSAVLEQVEMREISSERSLMYTALGKVVLIWGWNYPLILSNFKPPDMLQFAKYLITKHSYMVSLIWQN